MAGYSLFAYLLGSISTAIITCKLMGLPDPRSGGSKNPGATNVLRLGGKKAAAITLAGDMLKGLLPVLIAVSTGMPDKVIAATGLAAFLGHLYPVYYGFAGGKGVATLFGVLLGIQWMAGLATIGSWLVMAKLFKVSSLSALVAALAAPVLILFFTHSLTFTLTTAIMTVLLYWRHRSNIANLLSGAEEKIQSKN
ncbi:MAG TPA: glycerol-3-phosphate 1-O-acyltransferase PlsY [Pseudomonadales bacterium]